MKMKLRVLYWLRRKNTDRPSFGLARRGVSPRVLEAAKRLMKEYQADLEYLRDR